MPRGALSVRWLLMVVCGITCTLSCAAEQPVATVRLASVNRLLQDVDDWATLSKRPAISRFARRLLTIGNELKGLDRDRPLSLEVYLDQETGTPNYRLCLPLTNMTDFRETTRRLQWTWTSLDETNDEVQRPGSSRSIRVCHVDSWVLLSETSGLVDVGVQDAARAEAEGLADLSLTILPTSVTAVRVQPFLNAFQRQINAIRESARERQPQERELRLKLLGFAEKVITLLVNETESLEFRLNIAVGRDDTENRGIVIEHDWRVAVNGKLAAHLPGLAIQSPQFPMDVSRGAAFRVHAAAQLPEPLREIAVQAVDLARHAARREVSKLDDRTQTVLLGMFDSLEATFRSGHVESCTEFLSAGPHQMALLSGWRLEQGEKLATALPLLLTEIGESNEAKSVALNVARLQETDFHKLRDPEQREFDDLLYGGKSSIYLGVNHNVLWVVMGGDQSLQVCESRIRERGGRNNSSKLLATLEWHLRPWLPLVAATTSERRVANALQEVFASELKDGISGELRVHSEGLSGRIAIDAPFLKVPAMLVSENP